GAVLAASAELFTLLKLVGAVYLFWLGFQMWRKPPTFADATEVKDTSENKKMFLKAFTVTALNPKGIIFFVAFVPQFVDLSQPVFFQFVILEATFLTLAIINVILWAMLANKMRAHIKSQKTQNWVSRISGSCLMGAGFLTALIRRTA
ncbi:MAG: LysE family translocator, partial [Sneathiella sp.]